MRAFSTAIQAELNKRFGTEPLMIVEVEWVDGASVAYSDQKINGADYPYPLLVSISNFNTSTIVSGGGDSQNVKIVLNDIDGTMRSLIDQYDIHKRPVSIYLLFAGLPATEKVLLFSGVINSPIVWDEGSRTLSFDVLSKIEDREVAFTMEDGDFPFVPPDDRGGVWPLVFGKVCNMQTLPLTSLRKGFLATGQGVMDPTIDERLCQANKLQCPEKTAGLTDDPAAPTGTTGSGEINVRVGQKDQQCLTRRFNEICSILHEKNQQSQYVQDTMTIRGGADFPQNTLIDIKINDVRFTGRMNGETFTVTQVYHPALETVDNPECKTINESAAGFRRKANGNTPTDLSDCTNGANFDFKKNVTGGGGESWRYYQDFEKGSFIWLAPGSDVFLNDEANLIYVVSLIPGVVNQVAAYRTFGDTTLLVEVPTDRYTVHTVDYGGYEVVELRLTKALSTYDDEDWSDDIYVSFTSDVGPNPADVIEWLVDTYTDLTIDTASFSAWHTRMANYPANFYIKERKPVLDLIQDIAYQFRSAVVVRNNVISLVYLSLEPTSQRTLTESDIVVNSFQVTHTETEDLETRHEISWQETDASVNADDDEKLQFVLKYNIPKYGVQRSSYNYYTMNIFEAVEKSATFWLIRKSQTWKYVEFETPLKHLGLEIFDSFTLNIAQFPTVKCVVTEANYDADSNTIKFKAWTPILAGTDTPFYWAWPAGQEAAAVWPLVAQDGSGDGYPFVVTPPADHPLRAGYDADTQQVWTAGDRHPSDLDDSFMAVECKLATGAEIAPDLEPVIVPFEPLADENFNDKLDDIAAGGVGGGEDDEEEKNACGDPMSADGGFCTYEVRITYITPDLVTTRCQDGSPCSPGCYGPCARGGGTQGRPCTGSQHQMCHTFGSMFAATLFRSQKAAEAAELWNNCRYVSGQTAVLSAGAITGIEGDGAFGECDSAVDIPHALDNEGEIQQAQNV